MVVGKRDGGCLWQLEEQHNYRKVVVLNLEWLWAAYYNGGL